MTFTMKRKIRSLEEIICEQVFRVSFGASVSLFHLPGKTQGGWKSD